MNEQLQAKLVEILSGIQSATKAAGDFALEQLPDIAQSYVMYGRVTGLFYSAAWLAAFVCSWRVALKYGYFSKAPNQYGMWPDTRIAVVVFGTFAIVVCGVISMYTIGSAALVWFAPKVWLLKELASLVK